MSENCTSESVTSQSISKFCKEPQLKENKDLKEKEQEALRCCCIIDPLTESKSIHYVLFTKSHANSASIDSEEKLLTIKLPVTHKSPVKWKV